jgi:hypothetical protein
MPLLDFAPKKHYIKIMKTVFNTYFTPAALPQPMVDFGFYGYSYFYFTPQTVGAC